MKKKLLAYGDLERRICLRHKLVARNFFCSSRSIGDNGYTQQLIDAGASGFRSIAWSQGRQSGNFSESFSWKTFACRWYCAGTSSCQGLSPFFSLASIANCCAMVFFRMVKCCHTSSPASHPGRDRTQRGIPLFCRGVPFFGGDHLSVSSVDSVVVLASVASDQLIMGAQASRKGYPRMKLSGPISAMKKTCVVLVPRWLVMRSTASVIFPALFDVPLTFRTLRGTCSFRVFKARWFIIRGWMKHSVAPLSRSAFWSTLFFLVLSMNRT